MGLQAVKVWQFSQAMLMAPCGLTTFAFGKRPICWAAIGSSRSKIEMKVTLTLVNTFAPMCASLKSLRPVPAHRPATGLISRSS